jgi:hypothetical protein
VFNISFTPISSILLPLLSFPTAAVIRLKDGMIKTNIPTATIEMAGKRFFPPSLSFSSKQCRHWDAIKAG